MLAPRRQPDRALSRSLPSQCAVCRVWGAGRICAPCLGRFAMPVPRCRRCALAVPPGVAVCGSCLTSPPPFDRAIAAVDYGAPWDRLVTAFKFHDGLDLAGALASVVVAAVARSDDIDADRSDEPPTERSETTPLLLPVPLSAERLRERGYNQAWELARRIARSLGLEADASLLLRVRDTAHQLALPPEQRAGNVRAAFAVEPRRRAELAGRRVAVVDDVMTTASTAAEIARVLKQAGAAEVAIWVLARTPRPGDE